MRLDEYQIANALIDTRLVMTSRHSATIPGSHGLKNPWLHARFPVRILAGGSTALKGRIGPVNSNELKKLQSCRNDL